MDAGKSQRTVGPGVYAKAALTLNIVIYLMKTVEAAVAVIRVTVVHPVMKTAKT